MIKLKIGDIVDVGGNELKVMYDVEEGKFCFRKHEEKVFGEKLSDINYFCEIMSSGYCTELSKTDYICFDDKFHKLNSRFTFDKIMISDKLSLCISKLIKIGIEELQKQNERIGK